MALNKDRYKCVMSYTNQDGETFDISASILDIIAVSAASHGTTSDYLITFRETRTNGYKREFTLSYSELNANLDATRKLLNQNGFIFLNHFDKFFRSYITDELMDFITKNKLSYYHTGLGFTQMANGERKFLLGDVPYENLVSVYRDRNNLTTVLNNQSLFKQGDEAVYQKFLEDEILPHKATRYALTLGLCSVIASDLKDFADIGTLVLNLSGESSSGKTTIAQFIASLWGSPRISNRGIVRTFISTDNSMIHTFAGTNGVSIVIDDATSRGTRDFTSFLYQASAGEDKLRMKSGSELQESNGNWSGAIVITSEDDLMEFSNQTAGSIPRLLRLNNILWTKSAEHSKRIKRTIEKHYGFIGKAFVDQYMRLDQQDIIKVFEKYDKEIDDKLLNRDQYTPRIVSKLAVIATTAHYIEQFFSYPNYSANEILDMIIRYENSVAKGRSLEHKALDIVKEYIVSKHNVLPKKVVDPSNSRRRVIEINSRADYEGYVEFKSENLVEVTLMSSVVKQLLEKNEIYQWNTVLKRWKEMPFIKKYGQNNQVSETDNHLKVKAITFILSTDEESMTSWHYYQDRAEHHRKRNVLISPHKYDDEAEIDEIFEKKQDDD